MPARTYYSSGHATLQEDGSIFWSGTLYEWDGVAFRRAYSSTPLWIAAEEVTTKARRIAGHVASQVFGPYQDPDDAAVGWMDALQLACLRLAVLRGYTSLEAALDFLDTWVYLVGSEWWGFTGVYPELVPAAQEESFFRPRLLTLDLLARDALLKPNGWVDTSVAEAGTAPWSVAGDGRLVAIAAAWLDHPTAEIAGAARQILGLEPAPLLAQPIRSAVAFEVAESPDADRIAMAYLAFFQRPADGLGFNHHASVMQANGGDWKVMAAAFGHSPEYLDTYAGMGTAQRIDAMYRNLFGRPAEPAGLEYWSSRLDAGAFTPHEIALGILLGAQNGDATVIAHRLRVCAVFTRSLSTWEDIAAYDGPEAAARVRQLLGTVTADPATVSAATSAIPALQKTLGTGGAGAAGALGDVITLHRSTRDIVQYHPQDGGRRDEILGLQAHDVIDLSALDLPARSSARFASAAPEPLQAGFFRDHPVVIALQAAGSDVYVDVDADGNFRADRDLVIGVKGVAIEPGQLVA